MNLFLIILQHLPEEFDIVERVGIAGEKCIDEIVHYSLNKSKHAYKPVSICNAWRVISALEAETVIDSAYRRR